MLTFDQLSKQTEVVERQVLRKAVHRNIRRNLGCMALPLTILYFVFYALAARLHEDIVNVFFMESELRNVVTGHVEEIETIPALWDYLEGDFFNMFFKQTDMYGETLRYDESDVPGDKWGDWGKVLTYNQIQGLVRVECSRESTDNFFGLTNEPYNGPNKYSPVITRLQSTQEGFMVVRDQEFIDRRLKANAAQHEARQPHETEEEHARRLRLTTSEMRSSLPKREKNERDRFRFWLYPAPICLNPEAKLNCSKSDVPDDYTTTLQRLKYFRAKRWLDENTKSMVITLYLLNPDLGRPRLVELKIVFGFSRAGGVFYEVDLQTMMMKMFPGFLSMLADAGFFIILIITTLWRWQMLWRSFVKGHFLDHILQLFILWEWVIIMCGWFNVYGFMVQTRLIRKLNKEVEAVRELQWDGSIDNYEEVTLSLYDVAQDVSYQLGWIRVLMGQYCLCLMWRFFISFGAQPRLAIVTQTLKAVLPDLLHFMIVFFPTLLAYVISGNLIFGRRMSNFATVQSSFATCFRIIMECEYDWDTLALEHYWTTGIWIWSFIVLLYLLMVNMVLAIVLDVYNDVRLSTNASEMVWTTIYNFWLRFREMKFWVPDKLLEAALTTDIQTPMVVKDDFKENFPGIPDTELNLLYKVCAKDMVWESNKFLDKATALKVSGSVKLTSDKLNVMVGTMGSESDPLHGFTNVKPQTSKAAKRKMGAEGLFLTSPARLKGNREPHVTVPGVVPKQMDALPEDAPEWQKETVALLTKQKQWMLWMSYQLQSLQWQLQMSHMRNKGDRKSVV